VCRDIYILYIYYICVYIYICVCVYIYIYTLYMETRGLLAAERGAYGASEALVGLHVENAERRILNGILFIRSPFCEYSSLAYVYVPV